MTSATYRALRIDTDGSRRVVNVPRTKALPLLQHWVGGPADSVSDGDTDDCSECAGTGLHTPATQETSPCAS